MVHGSSAWGTRFPYYTHGNAADVLADPVSPLGWTFLWEGAISPGARDGFIVFGLVDWDEFETPEDPECFGLFGGYFYNPLSIVRLMGARLPGRRRRTSTAPTSTPTPRSRPTSPSRGTRASSTPRSWPRAWVG